MLRTQRNRGKAEEPKFKRPDYFANLKANYTTREVNHKMKSLVDLIIVYEETNQKVIERCRSTKTMNQLHPLLVELSGLLTQIKDIFG